MEEVKSILKLLFAILIASTSAFFIVVENAEVVEAKVCPNGEFPRLNPDKTITCMNATPVNDDSEERVGAISGYLLAFARVVMVFSSSLSVIMITYSGFLYITSEGNPMKVDLAKRMLIRAGIGVLVLTSSFMIMNLIMTAGAIS